MKFNFPVNNFSAGEWSPKMSTRTDVQEIVRSCKTLTNYIPQIHGGAQFRGGFSTVVFDDTVQTAFNGLVNPSPGDPYMFAKGIVLIPFKDSEYLNRGLVMAQPVGGWYILKASGAIGTRTAITDNTTWATSLWKPEDIQYVQLGDILVMTSISGNYPPAVLYYDSGYKISPFSTFAATRNKAAWESQPYGNLNALGVAQTLSVPAATNTVGSSFTLTASSALWAATDVGRYIRLANGTAKDGVVRITGYTNSTTVTVIIEAVLPNVSFVYGSTTNSSSFWLQTEWSNTTGYPRTVTVFQGRIIFGGTKAKKDTLWASRISNYFDFMEIPYANTTGVYGFASSAFTSDNSRPFTLTPNTPESSAIVNLSSGKTLTVHTESTEIVAYGSNGALGPLNVVMESNTAFGASGKAQPRRVNNFSTFVQCNGYKLRDMTYSFDQDQYVSADLSFMAEHFFIDSTSHIVDEIYDVQKLEQRSSNMFVQTRGGKLYCITIDRDYKINAWSRISIAGNSPVVIAIAPFIGLDDAYDSTEYLYALVRRTTGLTQTLNLVKLNIAWEFDQMTAAEYTTYLRTPPIYLDFSIEATPIYSVPPPSPPPITKSASWDASSIAYPLSALPGVTSPFKDQTVSVIADGNYIGEFAVDSSGLFTLPLEYSRVQIGFKYQGIIEPAPVEQGGQIGVPVGRQKRVDEMVIFFHKSMGTKYGATLADLIEIPMRSASQPMGTPVEYFTGDKTVQFLPGYNRAYTVVIVQDKPYPSYIKAVAMRGVTYD